MGTIGAGGQETETLNQKTRLSGKGTLMNDM